jgi:hypothetical protein
MSKFLAKWQSEVGKESPQGSRLTLIMALTASVGNDPSQGSVIRSQKNEGVKETQALKLTSAAVGSNQKQRKLASEDGGMGAAVPEGKDIICKTKVERDMRKRNELEEPGLPQNRAQTATMVEETNWPLTIKQKFRGLALSMFCCFRE